MTNEEAIAIIRKEYLCVDRDCDIERSCGKCDLAMPAKEPILEAYNMAIKALETIPKYKDAYGKGWDDGAKATYEHLKMCEEEQSGDLISRQAALVSIKNLYPDMPVIDIMSSRRKWLEKYAPYFECENAIEQLPPVNSQPICEERERGECPYYAG